MIAIISDIHDNLANLKTALDYAKSKSVSALFVLGDVTNADTLKYIAKNFSEKIYLVSGNMEVSDLEKESKKYPNIIYLGRRGGVIKIADRKIGLCHEPHLANDLIKQGAEMIFYGHTHKPHEELKNGAKLVNPGNISNTIYAASFALWNEITNELELKIL
jgi:putative phosphoesterase